MWRDLNFVGFKDFIFITIDARSSHFFRSVVSTLILSAISLALISFLIFPYFRRCSTHPLRFSSDL